MPKGFKVDVKKCVGCNACVVACKAENKTRKGVSYRKVVKLENGSVLKTYSVACNHCVNPACKLACPVKDTVTKDAVTGVVLIAQATCIGCRRCEWACPYGAPRYNSTTQRVEKCTYCQHNTARGPACAATCITGTLEAINSAPSTSYNKNVDGVFPSSGLTEPNTYWRDDWNKTSDA